MLELSDARHFRRLVAGFCLIAAPVVLLTGALLHPQNKDPASARLAVVADNPRDFAMTHTGGVNLPRQVNESATIRW